MNILIIGDAFSQYTVAFSKFLKQYDPSIKIEAFNTRAVRSDIKYTERFKNVYDKIYENGFINKYLFHIPKIRGLAAKIANKKAIREVDKAINTFDVICIHGFWRSSIEIYNQLSTAHIFTVGVVWGFDLYQRTIDDKLLFDSLDRCDRIVISTDQMIKDLKAVYPVSQKKIRKCIFGLEPLETLIKAQHALPVSAKEEFGLKGDTFIVTCGYNGDPCQDHFTIISEMSKIRSKLPPSYLLVFPLTYGGSSNYIRRVESELKKSGLRYLVIKKYLSDENISLLRLVTDIFIHIQANDALSGSMREHLFAKNVVITGAWLPYESLVKDGIYFETIKRPDQLGDSLIKICANYAQIKHNVSSNNTPEKFQQFRWPVCIKKWHNVFLEHNHNNL